MNVLKKLYQYYNKSYKFIYTEQNNRKLSRDHLFRYLIFYNIINVLETPTLVNVSKVDWVIFV